MEQHLAFSSYLGDEGFAPIPANSPDRLSDKCQLLSAYHQNLVRNSQRILAFLAVARRDRTGTTVHEGVGMCARAGNLLCYNLWAPLVDRDDRDLLRAFLTC
jgi:hypothetical protein